MERNEFLKRITSLLTIGFILKPKRIKAKSGSLIKSNNLIEFKAESDSLVKSLALAKDTTYVEYGLSNNGTIEFKRKSYLFNHKDEIRELSSSYKYNTFSLPYTIGEIYWVGKNDSQWGIATYTVNCRRDGSKYFRIPYGWLVEQDLV